MDLSYGPEYEDFRAELRAFIEKNQHKAPPAGMGMKHPEALEQDWQKLLIENGYTCRTIPKKYGGYGAEPDILKTVIIQEEFTKANVNSGLSGQGIGMLVPTLLENGNEEQREKYIRPTIYGEIHWCQGYSEPGAGSDLASLRTNARVEDDHFIINGQKIWTSGAHFADMCFILVRTEPDKPKHEGISYIMMDMKTPGIEVRPLVTMTGAAEFNETFLTDVKVPVENVVGKRGEGWKVANTTLKHERGMLGDPGQMLSRIESILKILQNEKLDGKRLIEHDMYRDRLIAAQAKTEALKFHSLRLLSHTLKNEEPGVSRLIVKYYGTTLARELSDIALEALGELGQLYMGSPHVRSHGSWQWRNMFDLGLIIGGGTSQIQKNIISERGLGMPREPKLAETK
ncbi:MAG: acyl-CoA dehydrogenase family protein [Alphaproteobacteria bacterium]|nr:acyl-CoA dehydrogenase family protein [Alphaproteobacteria bacterium]